MRDHDRRKLRSEQSRRLFLHAFLDLIAEGNRFPSCKEIAKRAGRSDRTLFNLFGDLPTLYEYAIEYGVDGRRLYFFVGPEAPRAAASRAGEAAALPFASGRRPLTSTCLTEVDRELDGSASAT